MSNKIIVQLRSIEFYLKLLNYGIALQLLKAYLENLKIYFENFANNDC